MNQEILLSGSAVFATGEGNSVNLFVCSIFQSVFSISSEHFFFFGGGDTAFSHNIELCICQQPHFKFDKGLVLLTMKTKEE